MQKNNRMNDINTPATTVSVHDRFSGRQANNLFAQQLPEAVRPWFEDWNDDEGIATAIEALREPHMRTRAADYLGLELIPAA
ncbi:MAG: hypothetical protein L0H81_04345 [Actinomyces sp.]|nr:hypothetical protein [Actinomyces sp.]MDN6794342.1 hypothetical protein [Propionibacterium sp.]